jgi:hypothetical protein
MSDSILDRIRQNRNRTRVPQRDDVLVSKSPSNEQGSQLDNPTSERLLNCGRTLWARLVDKIQPIGSPDSSLAVS